MPSISPVSNEKLCIKSKRRTPPPNTIKGKIRVSPLKLKREVLLLLPYCIGQRRQGYGVVEECCWAAHDYIPTILT